MSAQRWVAWAFGLLVYVTYSYLLGKHRALENSLAFQNESI